MIIYLICGFNKGMGTSLEEKQFALQQNYEPSWLSYELVFYVVKDNSRTLFIIIGVEW